MKFFKHFVDAHRGHSMQCLFEEFGHMGISCYWTLVEMCSEKLEKNRDEECQIEHCVFDFNPSTLRKNLRISSTKLEKFLNKTSELSLLSWKKAEQKFIIEMPKLLESLDRDSRRARPERATAAPKRESEDKELDKDNKSDAGNPTQPNELKSETQVLEMIPIVSYEKWCLKFTKPIVDLEITKAIEYHQSDPGHVFWRAMTWNKKLITWFNGIKKNELKTKNDTFCGLAEI